MNLETRIQKIEQQTNTKGLCPHLPPIICHADGTTENESNHHDCGLPRLRIVVVYTDGSDERTKKAAHQAFAEIRREVPDFPKEEAVATIAKWFGSEAAAGLMAESTAGSTEQAL